MLRSTGAEGAIGTVVQSFDFTCPQCGVSCVTRKVKTAEGDIEVDGRTFTGGLHIEIEHDFPCSMFKNMDINDYLRAVSSDILEKKSKEPKKAKRKRR